MINPPELGHLPQILHGSKNEETAVSHLKVLLEADGHKNVSVTPCGLFIYPDKQYLGASPDGIVTCSCHPNKLLEIKCPSSPISKLSFLRNDGNLKKKSAYYCQIQGQMLVTGIRECYFFVYCGEASKRPELITYDQQFCNSLEANLEIFYRQYMAPQLLGKK